MLGRKHIQKEKELCSSLTDEQKAIHNAEKNLRIEKFKENFEIASDAKAKHYENYMNKLKGIKEMKKIYERLNMTTLKKMAGDDAIQINLQRRDMKDIQIELENKFLDLIGDVSDEYFSEWRSAYGVLFEYVKASKINDNNVVYFWLDNEN